jgi:hypothetical protein
MNIELETITPQMAADWLKKNNTKNRRLRQAWVDKMARDIKAGAFLTTHQGIAFDGNGVLLDGQHRLAAIVKSGKALTIIVVRGVPSLQRVNGTHLNAWNAIDQGRARQAGEVLQMQGLKNGMKLAAVVRSLIMSCNGGNIVAVSLPQIQLTIEAVGQSIETCVMLANANTLFRPPSYVVAAATLLHTKMPVQTEAFLQELSSITGSALSPSRALITWIKRHPQCGGHTAYSNFKTTASALKAHIEEAQRFKIYSSESAYQWLCDQNRPLVKKIASIVTV